MIFSLFDSLTRQKKKFEPINKDLVKLYVCGPTVYDYVHIGNARTMVVYDLLYRVLKIIYGSEKILYVRNITDIDDKIINKAQRENLQYWEVSSFYTKKFYEDMEFLGVKRANYEPKVSESIGDIIDFIKILLSKKIAYYGNEGIYFNVAFVKDYGALSGQNLMDLIPNVRNKSNVSKKSQYDFALWKFTSKDSRNVGFESPFGFGRPGWHIECSAMSYKYLGKNFDIHGGGIDLLFPHHTNEIAQSKAAFSDSLFAHYWSHTEMLTVGGKKMSKSLNNFLTLNDMKKKAITANALRFFFLNTHYRHPLDFNDRALHEANKTILYWQRALYKVKVSNAKKTTHTIKNLESEFKNALLNDLNTHLALKIINDYVKKLHVTNNENEQIKLYNLVLSSSKFLGFKDLENYQYNQQNVQSTEYSVIVNRLVELRTHARKLADWKKADRIKSVLLLRYNIELEDRPDYKTIWKKIK